MVILDANRVLKGKSAFFWERLKLVENFFVDWKSKFNEFFFRFCAQKSFKTLYIFLATFVPSSQVEYHNAKYERAITV